jgi:hypothetical protein
MFEYGVLHGSNRIELENEINDFADQGWEVNHIATDPAHTKYYPFGETEQIESALWVIMRRAIEEEEEA